MRYACLCICAAALFSVSAARADEDTADFTITIKNHHISPAVLDVPAGKRLRLTVKNEDATAEEAESQDMDFEKIIPPNSEGTLYIRPLEAGKYHYYGDFNQATAQADIIAK